jgi:hypothetical protein
VTDDVSHGVGEEEGGEGIDDEEGNGGLVEINSKLDGSSQEVELVASPVLK